MNDLISIIIPVYNVKNYLEECVESVLNQTYRNLEVIIVDDGSTDGSEFICDKYKETDNRVIVIHQPNMGLSSARNTGICNCKGKYLCFVDSDDYIESRYVEELYNSIKKYNVRISICGIKTLKNGKYYSESLELLNNSEDLIKGKDGIFNTYVWNKMYDSTIWKNIKFDIDRWYEDIFIMYHIMYPEEYVSVVNNKLYVYRKRNESISGDIFAVDKCRDFLEARKQRMIFFENKEKYLFDVCVKKYLGAIRKYYSSLYIQDKKNNKKETAALIKEYRKMVNDVILGNRYGLKENIIIFVFYIMPDFFAKVKHKIYLKRLTPHTKKV